MITITIPKELARKGDLVVIPRREYDTLLKRQRIIPMVQLTMSEKKALDRARKEIARGEFLTLKELKEKVDADSAIKIYKKEKQQGKLKTIKLLSGICDARKEVRQGKIISQEKLFKQLGF